MAEIEGWSCGLAICYDLRFPELFRYYSRHGAALFFVPSNFTQKTGKDHWETLARARAIENQAFVVAPNQCGVNPRTGIASHGHSLVVGPWGDVLAVAGDKETILTVALQPEALHRTRARIPVLRHRRLG
jgi:nitrilase